MAPKNVTIWDRKVPGGIPNIYASLEKPGGVVTVNLGEEYPLYCTSWESRPSTYIAWTANGASSTFLTSDCVTGIEVSDPNSINPLTMTYDTTKCGNLFAENVDHGRKVYCTATNEANTVGIETYVTLYVCSKYIQKKNVNPSHIST